MSEWYVSIYLSIYLSNYLSIYLSTWYIYIYVHYYIIDEFQSIVGDWKHSLQCRTGSFQPHSMMGLVLSDGAHSPQIHCPHRLQWCRRLKSVKGLLQIMQLFAALSGIHSVRLEDFLPGDFGLLYRLDKSL